MGFLSDFIPEHFVIFRSSSDFATLDTNLRTVAGTFTVISDS